MKNVLLVGCGSIGRRHALNLLEKIPEAQFFIIRESGKEDEFTRSLPAQVFLNWQEIPCQPDLVILANPSAFHYEYIEKIIAANLPAYIEKPLVTTQADLDRVKTCLKNYTYTQPTMVGCNLRALPSIVILKQIIQEGRVGTLCRAYFEVGQYLPTWRKDQDYRKSYSAKADMGGGVIFDLVHELDLVRYLLGQFEIVSCQYAKLSHLELEVEDTASIHLTRPQGPFVCVQLDYVSRQPVRQLRLIGDEGTLIWDLIEKKLILKQAHGMIIISDNSRDFDVANTYKTTMGELVDAVQQGRETFYSLQDAIQTTELMLRCKNYK